MEPKKNKPLYPLLLAASLIYIVYVSFMNLLYDPNAVAFLSHKVNLARPLNIPTWLNVMHVHVIAACLAMLAGVINFSTSLLRKRQWIHRMNGYLYVVFVLVVCLTSGYMAPYSTGGKINSVPFNLLNIIWIVMTITAVVKIKRKQVIQHRKWMIRSFAFCFTNIFIHLITNLLTVFGMEYELSYTFGVYGSIIVNFILAQIVITYMHPKKATISGLNQAGSITKG